MSLVDFLLGRPIASNEEQSEKIGPGRGTGIFGLDALGSAIYGPEAALTILIPFGLAATSVVLPVIGAVVVLLLIVFFSYRQTIKAYPSEGGTFSVASKNLGSISGVFAGTALMIDYALVVAVGISAGVGSLVSIFDNLKPYTLLICIVILLFITIINARGVNDTGAIFAFPAYLFIFSMIIMLALGFWKTLMAGGSPQAVIPPPVMKGTGETITLWLLLKSFSNGCTAMTGVEAVSNGVTTFKEPTVKNARITLSIIIISLALMLLGVGYLVKSYGITATTPDSPEYKSVIYILATAISGNSWFTYLVMGSVMLILVFQANTAFTGFPMLCRAMAQHGYLPQGFANRGRRLSYSHGIYVLSFLSLILLLVFQGVTDKLIPLFAVGALTAFTFSQAGMVKHWKKTKGRRYRLFMSINLVGAIATGITAMIVTITKFTEGAYMVIILVPLMFTLMRGIRLHYLRVEKQLLCVDQIIEKTEDPPIIILPAEEWNRTTAKALHLALSLSNEVTIIHVNAGEEDSNLQKVWKKFVEEPLNRENLPIPKLEVIQSPYRLVVRPIVNFILDVEEKNPERKIAVVLPTLVERRWFHRLLHNQRSILLTGLLLAKNSKRIIIINVPWYISKLSWK